VNAPSNTPANVAAVDHECAPQTAAAAVLIPDWWRAEQALAVFELLDDLCDTLWTIHGCRIQHLLQQESGSIASDV
jgi:hypothetical protein